MALFVAFVLVPACGFYAYALAQFWREAWRLRIERIRLVPARSSFAPQDPSANSTAGAAVTVFPMKVHASQRDVA
jgi:hypothetical protein